MTEGTIPQPNNAHSENNPVGRFMVAVGAIIIHAETGKVLVTQRSGELDWHPNEWEITYGRINQHEDPEDGLRREIMEENGISDLVIQQILRVWHIYRGPKSADNDLIGITYLCSTSTTDVQISEEHQSYKWVSAEEALNLISVEGIRKDIEVYLSVRE